MPQNEEGTRIDPFVSVPSARGTIPAATAAADPPEEPPADRPRVSRGVASRSIVAVLSREVIGVLPHIDGTETNRSGPPEPLDQGRVLRRRRIVSADLGARDRDHSLEIEEILDAVRSPRQGSRVASRGNRLIDGSGLGAGAIDREGRENVQRGIQGLGPANGRIGQREGG